jgi:hypothetical protein
MFAFGGKADNMCSLRVFLLLTHNSNCSAALFVGSKDAQLTFRKDCVVTSSRKQSCKIETQQGKA